MKTLLIHSIAIPLSALALSTSMALAADGGIKEVNNGTYSEKKSSAEFWADFEQDKQQTWADTKTAFRDGWIESKLETALRLNGHLHLFNISIQVDNNMATLEGEVHSEIEKELAGNIVLGAEGIDTVTNKIRIIEKPAKVAEPIAPQGRTFAQYVADVSTTAAIKSELLTAKDIHGTAINVDTLNRMVTLSGQVRSLEEKALAQAIAAKHNDVKGVTNNLQIK
jgi:hyperosmotically inducible protein